MATRLCAVTNPGAGFTLKLAAWTGLLNGDDGEPYQFAEWADRTFQLLGTFGAGGTVVLEGSNDGVNWSTLTDAAGSAMSYTAATLKQMTEAPLYVRPRVTAGDGTTSIAATILARRITNMR